MSLVHAWALSEVHFIYMRHHLRNQVFHIQMTFLGQGYGIESCLLQRKSKPDMEIVTRIAGPEVGHVRN